MLGIRYLKAKKKFSFVSIITIICILGILVGDMVMITVLSVMNGFQDDIRDKILGMRAHIDISALSDQPLTDYNYVIENIKTNKEITSLYPYIVLPCIMRTYSFTTLITVRSFEDNIFSTDKDFIKYFNFIEGNNKSMASNEALIGSEMAFDYTCRWQAHCVLLHELLTQGVETALLLRIAKLFFTVIAKALPEAIHF